MTVAPFRLARGAAVATVALVLATAGHAAASGGVPQPGPLDLVVAALVLAGCVVASARAWTLARLLPVLLGVSLLAHLTLALSTPSGAVDPRLAGLASAGHGHPGGHAGSLTPTMLVAHVAAALLAAALLARIDRAVALLWHLARRLLSAADLASPAPLAPAWTAARVRIDDGALLAAWAPVVPSRRGPPALLARA